jgi:hypothetical protein
MYEKIKLEIYKYKSSVTQTSSLTSFHKVGDMIWHAHCVTHSGPQILEYMCKLLYYGRICVW